MVINIIKNMYYKSIKEDLTSTAGELAFRILLSMPPIVIFITTIIGTLNLKHVIIEMYIIPGVSDLINTLIYETGQTPTGSVIVFTLVFTFISSTSAFKAVIKSVNKAHAITDNRSFIKKILLSAGLMLIFCLATIIFLIVWVFGGTIFDFFHEIFGLSLPFLTGFFPTIVSVFVMFIAISLIYKLSLVSKTKIWAGALFTVILIILATEGFRIFISINTSMSVIYGSLMGILVLIIWVYLISMSLMLGNILNAVLNENNKG